MKKALWNMLGSKCLNLEDCLHSPLNFGIGCQCLGNNSQNEYQKVRPSLEPGYEGYPGCHEKHSHFRNGGIHQCRAQKTVKNPLPL